MQLVCHSLASSTHGRDSVTGSGDVVWHRASRPAPSSLGRCKATLHHVGGVAAEMGQHLHHRRCPRRVCNTNETRNSRPTVALGQVDQVPEHLLVQ